MNEYKELFKMLGNNLYTHGDFFLNQVWLTMFEANTPTFIEVKFTNWE